MVSKARNKELKRLRGNAQTLWQDQQALLDRASSILREARRQANFLTQEEVLPRARDAYATRFAPYVTRSGDAIHVANADACRADLHDLSLRATVHFQSPSHFWPMQSVEVALFAVLAAVLTAVAVLLVARRGTA